MQDYSERITVQDAPLLPLQQRLSPLLNDWDFGEEVYRKPPWAIYRKGRSWIYVGISPDPEDKELNILDSDHALPFDGGGQASPRRVNVGVLDRKGEHKCRTPYWGTVSW